MVLLEMIRIGKRLCGGAVARPRQACGRRAALSVCSQFAQLVGFLVPLVSFPAFNTGFLAPAALLRPSPDATDYNAAAEARKDDPEQGDIRDRQAWVLRIKRIEGKGDRVPIGNG
jgi:hypothetical protein